MNIKRAARTEGAIDGKSRGEGRARVGRNIAGERKRRNGVTRIVKASSSSYQIKSKGNEKERRQRKTWERQKKKIVRNGGHG